MYCRRSGVKSRKPSIFVYFSITLSFYIWDVLGNKGMLIYEHSYINIPWLLNSSHLWITWKCSAVCSRAILRRNKNKSSWILSIECRTDKKDNHNTIKSRENSTIYNLLIQIWTNFAVLKHPKDLQSLDNRWYDMTTFLLNCRKQADKSCDSVTHQNQQTALLIMGWDWTVSRSPTFSICLTIVWFEASFCLFAWVVY